MNTTISIFGFGRFGQLLTQLLPNDATIKVFDPKVTSNNHLHVQLTTREEAANAATVFVAVPINQFATTIQQISPYLPPDATIIDICSVKVYPVSIMQKFLPPSVNIIATHPLFGPDSLHKGTSCKMMMHSVRSDDETIYTFWKQHFASQHIEIVEITPEEHDQLAANSQSLTHFIGRALQAIEIAHTPIDTLGFTHLLNIMKQTCNDSWELFLDLQRYNPYTAGTQQHFIDAVQTLQTIIKQAPSPLTELNTKKIS